MMAKDPRRKGRPKRPADVFKEAVEAECGVSPLTIRLLDAMKPHGKPCFACGQRLGSEWFPVAWSHGKRAEMVIFGCCSELCASETEKRNVAIADFYHGD
jgi:hypothetical protein